MAVLCHSGTQLRVPAAGCHAAVPRMMISSSLRRPAAAAAGTSRQRQRRPLHVCAIFSSTTSNPAFRFGNALETASLEARRGSPSGPMTVAGTINKAGLLLVMSCVSAAYTWMQIFSGNAAAVMATLGTAKAAGLVGVSAIVASMFKPQWAPYTAPLYALSKGCALAAMSAILELQFPGIAMSAILITFSTAGSLFAAVRTGLIHVTDRFADTVRAVTGGYLLAIMLVFLGGLVGLRLPGIFSGGPLGMAIHLVAAGLAAANMLLDMDWIERAAYQRAFPKWMEWYGAQSLMLTLVWMYSEVLRLLMMVFGGRQND